jgi:hypothetical protein
MNQMATSMTELKSSVVELASKKKNTVTLKIPSKAAVATPNPFAPLSQTMEVEAESDASPSCTTNPKSTSISHDL